VVIVGLVPTIQWISKIGLDPRNKFEGDLMLRKSRVFIFGSQWSAEGRPFAAVRFVLWGNCGTLI